MALDIALLERQIRRSEARRHADQQRIDAVLERARTADAARRYYDSVLRVYTSCIRFGWWWPGE